MRWNRPCSPEGESLPAGLSSTHGIGRYFVLFSPNFTCKWLDFLVFSDKDDKPEVPSHNSLNVDNSVGRKKNPALFEKG